MSGLSVMPRVVEERGTVTEAMEKYGPYLVTFRTVIQVSKGKEWLSKMLACVGMGCDL